MTSQKKEVTKLSPLDVAFELNDKMYIQFVLKGDDCPREGDFLAATSAIRNSLFPDREWLAVKIPDTGLPTWIYIKSMERRTGGKKETHFHIRGWVSIHGDQSGIPKKLHNEEYPFVGYYWPLSNRLELSVREHPKTKSLFDPWYFSDYKVDREFGTYTGRE